MGQKQNANFVETMSERPPFTQLIESLPATVPFVARYRKEQTGGLDEVQLRDIMEHQQRLTELEQRRKTILDAIQGQGQLTPALWATAGTFAALAGLTLLLTLIMQRSLRVKERGLIRASALRENVLPWSRIGRARVGKTELGAYHPKLIVEGPDGRLLDAYGQGLIRVPLEEAAERINAAHPDPRG